MQTKYRRNKSRGYFKKNNLSSKHNSLKNIWRVIYCFLSPKKINKISKKLLTSGWRSVVALFLILNVITGFGPINYINKIIVALAEKDNSTIGFYPENCQEDFSVENNISGWVNILNITDKPGVDEFGDFRLFNNSNSALYLRGIYGIRCSKFTNSEFMPEKIENMESQPKASVQNIDTSEFEAESPEDMPEIINNDNGSSQDNSENTIQIQDIPTIDSNISSEVIPDEIQYEDLENWVNDNKVEVIDEIRENDNSNNGGQVEIINIVESDSLNTESVIIIQDESSEVKKEPENNDADTENPDEPISYSTSIINGIKKSLSVGEVSAGEEIAAGDEVKVNREFKKANIKLSLGIKKIEEINENNVNTTETNEIEINEKDLNAEDNINFQNNIDINQSEVSTGEEVRAENEGILDGDEKTTEENTEEPGVIVSLMKKIINLKNIFTAQAEDNEDDNRDKTILTLWYSLSNQQSNGGEETWFELSRIPAKDLSNAINGGYLAIEAPEIKSWEDINNLKIKLIGGMDNKEYEVYIDSVWTEVEYKKIDGEETEAEKKDRWKNMLKFISEKNDFKINDRWELKFNYSKNNKKLSEWLRIGDYWNDISLSAFIEREGEKVVEVPLDIQYGASGDFTIKLSKDFEVIKPGKYSIKFVFDDNSGEEKETIELSHDFTWGVLAVNTNKSVYLPGEKAYLQMAVLDDFGHTICDADIYMEIVLPDNNTEYLSTENGLIERSRSCGPDNVTNFPDYFAFYEIPLGGIYGINLQSISYAGERKIRDQFIAENYSAVDIERIGPTRIYPIANYSMAFKIKINEDFSGDLEDFLPANFKIINQQIKIKDKVSGEFENYNSFISTSSLFLTFNIKEEGDKKVLAWGNLNLKQDDELEIIYIFDAPDISPELFLLGPFRLIDSDSNKNGGQIKSGSENVFFKEARQWQIASDAVNIFSAVGGTHQNWTNPGYGWDLTDNTYATRILPKFSADDSANYLLATSTNASSLVGTISKVEIGVEGYVETNNIITYLVPVFNGTTDGSGTYPISAANMGTADDNASDYVDITGDPNGPGASNWTWSDVINLDIKVYGNNSSNKAGTLYIDQIRLSVTYNTPPTGNFNSAVQKTDDTGMIDVSIEINDADGDNQVRAKMEYVAGSDCNFSVPLNPSINETDTNTTADFGDPKVDNSSEYQIGTTTGWILTSSGSNTVEFDWNSKLNIPDADDIYCLRLTASDGIDGQTVSATTTLAIDNKAPTAPGALAMDERTGSSISLYFGDSSVESNFYEYKVFYKEYDGLDVTEADTLHGSSTDSNLGFMDYGNAATTTIGGLLPNTLYSFSIWAYDIFGHKASSTRVDISTNAPPTGSINSAVQRTDGTGITDISIEVDDPNNDDTVRAKIEYVAGPECDFSFPLDPTIDETDTNTTADWGDPKVDNQSVYQIGSSTGWIFTSPGSNTVEFDWQSNIDEPDANDTYCIRLTLNDGIDDQPLSATTTLTLDNVAPTAPGALTSGGADSSSITLNFNSATEETNFSQYKIFYKPGASGVTEGDSEHVDSDLSDINYNSTTFTVVEGLLPNTQYVFNIWAYDSYGHKISSTEVAIYTSSLITNDSLIFTNPQSSNILIADGLTEWNFRAVISHDDGWESIASTTLKLADYSDNTSPYEDLEFIWVQSSDSFSEAGNDILGAAVISPASSSSCASNTCTLDFKLVFNANFASSSVNYVAQLYSEDDYGYTDEDYYIDYYQVKMAKIKQIHYRWRNDNGGE